MEMASKYQEFAQQAAAAYKCYTMTEEDTQECAEFLLALKHRPITPEPRRLEPEYRPSQEVCTPPTMVSPHHVQHINDRSIERKSEKGPPVVLDERDSMDTFLETLLDGSPLVVMSDRDLVPDPLFVAMSQMKPCSLSEADRVGCYKSRPLGFPGMCCKHCGGQPGFGKYFPETVRSLAQTTTSQTILKHISSKCRFCPPHVRQAVLELQRQQIIKDSSNTGRPRYGSRKVFFQRIWSRLHGRNSAGGSFEDNTPDQTPEHSDEDDARSTGMYPMAGETLVAQGALSRQKGRFGLLPTKKNLLKHHIHELSPGRNGDHHPSKRSRYGWGN